MGNTMGQRLPVRVAMVVSGMTGPWVPVQVATTSVWLPQPSIWGSTVRA